MADIDRSKLSVSVVIPAYNEEKRISKTLPVIDAYFSSKGLSFEVIVVDDGSKDNTVGVVERFIKDRNNVKLLKNGNNRGKGYSVKKGMLEARGENILFSDADLATPIQEYEKLAGWLQRGCDIAIGSRKIKDSNVLTPASWSRRFVGVLAHVFISLLGLKPDIVDTQCGFKVFKKETARHIFSRQILDGGMFDVEIIYIAIRNNFKVKEVPVSWEHKDGSTINVLKCILFDPWDLIRVKINYFLGRY
ncbi:MAG: dolichyl-phosphate beta-glucosyltransferase [Candidatus Omnitrophota bacterium]